MHPRTRVNNFIVPNLTKFGIVTDHLKSVALDHTKIPRSKHPG